MAYWPPRNWSRAASALPSTFSNCLASKSTVYLPRVRHYWVRYGRRTEVLRPLFPAYCFTRIELQWHDVRQCPGVLRVVKVGGDEPAHIADEVIDALRKRERDGAIDLPKARGPRAPRIGDRVRIAFGPFAGHSGLCTQISRGHVGVLLLMFKAQRQIRLRRDAVEPV
jgi:transcription antitermination factor NusG